jgi:two-component system, cell cycle sensor histidine kinase and response regulator CckA
LKKSNPSMAELRTMAEHRLEKTANFDLRKYHSIEPEMVQQICYELGVHQVELELQNDDLRQANLDLERSREAYFDLYELAPLSYFTLAEDNKIVQANRQSVKLFGFSREDLCTMAITKLIFPADQDIYYHFQRLENGKDGSQKSCELRMVKNSGETFWVQISANIEAESAEEKRIRLTVSDINRVKELESELILASKLSALGAISAGLCHEINNPLTVLLGNLQILERFINEPNKFEAKIQILLASCGRISKIVKDLQLFSGSLQSNSFRRQSLNKILADTLAELNVELEKNNISVVLENSVDSLVMCDAASIGLGLKNILTNSIEALELQSEKWIKIELTNVGDEIILRISNSGERIPEKIQDLLFDPLFTTKAEKNSLGLGLSVAEGIFRSHGAKFSLLKDSPQTCFEVRFPSISIC